MMLMLAVLALAAAEPPPADSDRDPPGTSVAELQQMYDQSCAAREYGAYDDLCDQLSHQLKDARDEIAREGRRKAAEARRHPQAPPQPPAPAQPATPASAPSSKAALPG